MNHILNFALGVFCFILAAAIFAGLPASALQPQAATPANPPAAAAEVPATQNLQGKIESVDTVAKTVKLEKLNKTIVLTDTTRYAAGLKFASLKAGMDVKIVASPRSDGRMEAIEISAASAS